MITYWSYKDALIQTYTLPYLKIIQKNRPQSSWLYLITLEQKHHKISQSEALAIENELSKSRIKLISYRYRPFGFSAMR